jgi:hypothetical protein
MSQHRESASGFDGVKVSRGFVRGLQGQVFKLEQTQQSLITQLEHANALVAEFHETSAMFQRKYDEALRQMEEMRREHGDEKAILNYNLEAANEETERERERNQVNSEQIALLERQVAQCVCDMTQTLQSQATTTMMGVDADDDMDMGRVAREELSPVSVSLPSPRTPMTPRARTQTPTLDPETPEPVTPHPPPSPSHSHSHSHSPSITQAPKKSFHFQYQCSPAMSNCDGLYIQ